MKIVAQKLSRFIRANRFYLALASLFFIISLVALILNGSFLFEPRIVTRFGDQIHYYHLAGDLLQRQGSYSYYTIGYPLLMVPMIVLTGGSRDWNSIMPLLISLQSLLMMPAAIYLIIRNKSKRFALATIGILGLYWAAWIRLSADKLAKFNFFGLIPLSEPLTVLLLIASYYLYLKWFVGDQKNNSRKNPNRLHYLILAAVIAWGLLTRNVSAILYAPIFVHLTLQRKFKQVFWLGGLTVLIYSPQLIYNYLSTGDPLFNGYVYYAKQRAAQNSKMILNLYGIQSDALFSVGYFKVNVIDLFSRYLPVILMCGLVLKRQSSRLARLVVVFSILNVLFFLSYWWSKADGLIDRFLLPNFFLLLFIFKNQKLKNDSFEIVLNTNKSSKKS